jgi:hypothetical protein
LYDNIPVDTRALHERQAAVRKEVRRAVHGRHERVEWDVPQTVERVGSRGAVVRCDELVVV